MKGCFVCSGGCAAKQRCRGCLSSPGLRQPSHLFNSPYILDSCLVFRPAPALCTVAGVAGGGLSPDQRFKERTSLLVLAQGGL